MDNCQDFFIILELCLLKKPADWLLILNAEYLLLFRFLSLFKFSVATQNDIFWASTYVQKKDEILNSAAFHKMRDKDLNKLNRILKNTQKAYIQGGILSHCLQKQMVRECE